MAKEGSTKIVKFMTFRVEVIILRSGHISHYGEYASSSTLSIYSTIIAIVLWDYNTAFLCCLFYMAVDMQIWALLTWGQVSVSDTQQTVRADGPLVYFELYYYLLLPIVVV